MIIIAQPVRTDAPGRKTSEGVGTLKVPKDERKARGKQGRVEKAKTARTGQPWLVFSVSLCPLDKVPGFQDVF